MSPFLAEIMGTAMLILLGNGVVANVVLEKSKGENSGWIVIAFGWGMAVFIGVFMVAGISGAHINPAVTIGLAVAGTFPWASVPSYILAQFIGAFIGATLVWLHYKPHFDATKDPDLKLAAFSTSPAIPNVVFNMISEIIGTFVLVLAVLYLFEVPEKADSGAVASLSGPFAVALVVFAIGLSLGGPTGYAINPARDLGPRIMHAILPIPNKGGSGWGYAPIPVIGPIIGGALAGLLFVVLN
ncbi:MAG: putative glycerol uptake facilitator protein [Saprospiraceae bacterium]|nr:MAG: putative glycerol uptake facilitator protein [Saprospiraceae bacterium]